MILIFAVDGNWNIGYDGDMLFKISKDLKRFRKLTENNIIVMGRKTFESLPNKNPLPNRINIIVTSNKEYQVEGALVVSSIEELSNLLKDLNPQNEMQTFMIGGGSLARQMIDYCNAAYITKINKTFENADTFIPNLDQLPDWKKVKESDYRWQGDLQYQYVDYIKI